MRASLGPPILNRSVPAKYRTKNSGNCVLALFAFLTVISSRWISNNSMPAITIPLRQTAPSPNAFDTYMLAANLCVNSRGLAVGSKDLLTLPRSTREAIVASNSAAINTFRTGLRLQYGCPFARNAEHHYQEYIMLERLANLLALDSYNRAERGDCAGAARSALDCLQLGAQVPIGSSLYGDLAGIRCMAVGRVGLWRSIGHLDGEELQSVLTRLDAICARQVTFADTMYEERYWSESALKTVLSTRDGLQGIAGPVDGEAQAKLNPLLYFTYSKKEIADNHKRFWDLAIADAGMPFAAHPGSPAEPSDPVSSALVGNYELAKFKHTECETQNELLLVTFALRCFKIEHGRYPLNLRDLAPHYIRSLPADPFAVTGSFGYKPRAGQCLLYSVGPDSVDDGGKQIDDPGRSAASERTARSQVDIHSRGDIVVGKNTR